MKRALQIAVFFEIPVRVHWSFFLLLAYIIYAGQLRSGDWGYTLWGVFFFLMLFTCVVLHEFGHALTARRFGVITKDIILSPIGGIARLSKLPEQPFQEFLVAAAGPAVNFAIVLLLLPLIWWLDWEGFLQLLAMFFPNFEQSAGQATFSWSRHFLPALLSLNLALGIFNLLPAFPMDGGRIFRALLAIRLPRLKATRIAAITGQTLAIFLAIYGAYTFNFVTSLIGVFVFLSAGKEYQYARFEARLAKFQVLDVLHTDMPILSDLSTVSDVRRIIEHSPYRNFLVLSSDHPQDPTVIGLLCEDQYKKSIKQASDTAPILPWVQTEFEKTTPETSLKEAYEKMQIQKAPILPVYQNDVLVGMVDANHAGHFVETNG
jgi:Zn-dependent protease